MIRTSYTVAGERSTRLPGESSLAVLNAVTWFAVGGLTLVAAPELVQAGEGGFLVNLKRLLLAGGVMIGGLGITRLCLLRGAPLAAQGSTLALAASIGAYAVLSPLTVSIGYMGFAAPEVPKIEARERCAVIREQAGTFDQVAVGQVRFGRQLEGPENDLRTRSRQEAQDGRGTGKKSAQNRPQPITHLYGDGERVLAKAREQFQRAESERTQKISQLQQIAEDCERTIALNRLWAKNGAGAVAAHYDRAAGLTREIGQAVPVEVAKGIAPELRGLGASIVAEDRQAVDDARSVLRQHADRLEKAVIELPRSPEPMPPLAPSSLISAAFEPAKLQALWPYLLLAMLIEGGSPLSWVFAYVLARSRVEETEPENPEDGDQPSRAINGRARS